MNNSNSYHYLFKVVLVGNSCVGKSSIVFRYADDDFSQIFLATIGVDFRFKSFTLNNHKLKLQIWDTAGHQRFRTITSSYYRGAHALFVVFDITNAQSFQDAINYWYNEILNCCPPETQVLLIGNKNDLANNRQVSIQQVEEFLQKHPTVQYIQTSAKTSQGVQQAFEQIANMLIKQKNKNNTKTNISPKQFKKSKQIKNTQKLQQKTSQNYKQYCCNT